MPSEVPLPVSNFEVNNTDHSRRRRGKAGSSSARKPLNAKKVDLAGPTPERLAKAGSEPIKTQAGHYRAPHPIERMRDRKQLDPRPDINQAKFEAAEKLYEYFYASGLSGVAAQDISKTVRGSGESPSGMPMSEGMAHCRQQFRDACHVLAFSDLHPFDGPSRITLGVVCYEMNIGDAGAKYLSAATFVRDSIAMDRLRDGLLRLAQHWKLCR